TQSTTQLKKWFSDLRWLKLVFSWVSWLASLPQRPDQLDKCQQPLARKHIREAGKGNMSLTAHNSSLIIFLENCIVLLCMSLCYRSGVCSP
uniref:Uncharacterized protein n=1 Tax=Sinocyclocheilus rhinocerous TaxID=307959 RepID=A0A673FVH2_9TELE